MSVTSPPSRILLPSSSKISLNERFTKMAKVKPLKEPVTVVKKMNPVASIKNRRLAMQMANRPSVQAALKIKKVYQLIPCFFSKVLRINFIYSILSSFRKA